MKISWKDILVDVVFTNRKSIALFVDSSSNVKIRCPFKTKKTFLIEFLDKHQSWVEKRLQRVKKIKKRTFSNGSIFLFLGKEYPLEIKLCEKNSVKLQAGKLKVCCQDLCNVKVYIQCWYRLQANRFFPQQTRRVAKKMGANFASIKITSAKKRWGSCSSRGNICINWKLIQAPISIINYVLIHELVHTIFHNHSKAFWEKVKQVCPKVEERKRWLKDNGNLLTDI